MGLAQAKQTSPSLIWLDLEGGMGNKPIWDAAVVHDSPNSTLHAVRYCRHETPYHRSKLKKSLPLNTFAGMHANMTYRIPYAFSDQKWVPGESQAVKGGIGVHIGQEIAKGTHALAWNMHGHDAKILRRHIPLKFLDKIDLLDPLKWFRHHFSLPSNTLSSNRPGTPRAVMKAGNYSYMGPEHSALVDTLHMRDVTREAARQIAEKQDADINVVTVLQTPRKDDAWLWHTSYWDDNNKLHRARSKEFKRRLKTWLQEQSIDLSPSDHAKINAFSRMDTLRRYLNDQWEVV